MTMVIVWHGLGVQKLPSAPALLRHLFICLPVLAVWPVGGSGG